MIFPDLVLGNASAKRMSSGFAMDPIDFATCAINSSRKFADGLDPLMLFYPVDISSGASVSLRQWMAWGVM
jgi:hypothetical protein